MIERLKALLPGKPTLITLTSSFSIQFSGHKSKWKPFLFSHQKGERIEGYPGQYSKSPHTHLKVGPLTLFIHWKEFDQLYESEYYAKYGTYEPIEETYWERKRREDRTERLERSKREARA